MADRRAETAAESRRKITQAAARVFAAKGYEAASISEILEEAGVARRTFYRHYESKKALFLELMEGYFAEYHRLLEENRDRLMHALESNVPLFDAWRQYARSMLEFNSRNPELTILAFREAQGQDERFAARLRELDSFGRQILAENFRILEKHGLVVPFDVDLVASIINGAFMGIVLDHILGKRKPDVDRLADDLVRYQARALTPNRSLVDKAIPPAK